MVCPFNALYFLDYEDNLEFLIRRRIFLIILIDSVLTFSKKENEKINLFIPKIC